MGKREDLAGKKFNMLTIIEDAEDYIDPKGKRYVRVKALCDCGNYTIADKSAIKNGILKSCGCLHKKVVTTHNGSKSSLYRLWSGVKARCLNKNSNHYKRYGGRGIKICESWLNFETFKNDVGVRPSKKHTLDRINNDGDYCKENCRWSTKREQSNNRVNNVILEYNGARKTLIQWARYLGINESTFYYRYKNKMPLEKIMSKKMHTGNNQHTNKY